MNNIISSIQKLVEAEKNLKKASATLPPHINRAVIELQKEANIGYFEALSIIGKALNFSDKTKKILPKGFGGNVHPKNMNEIKKRIKNRKGCKQECYKAALELLQKEGKWIAKQEFKLKIMKDMSFIKLRQRINACLPVRYILETNGRGCYRARKYTK